MKVDIKWKNNMLFKSEADRNRYTLMDTVEKVGGQDAALTPKEMILSGLGGCTGMDVISILRKMKIYPDKFEIEVSAELENDYPKEFKSFLITYKFWGNDLDKDKINKAVELSEERYCGVSETLKQGAELDSNIEIYEK